MKILEITDKDVGLQPKQNTQCGTRTAARAVLKKNGHVALLNVSKHHYYKLPGGGVEEGETIEEALKREIQEETGCTFRVLAKLGEIVEYRSHENRIQTSHCFIAQVEKEGKANFTDEEIRDGFRLVWKTIGDAMDLLKKSQPDTYDGKFIVRRDSAFLQQAKAVNRS